MDNLVTDDYEKRVIRLLERIESKRQLQKLYRQATEPSQLMIDENNDLLQQAGLSYKTGKEQLALLLWLHRLQNHDCYSLPG